MADGLNHIRAVRIAEIMNDFRRLQHQIAEITSCQPLQQSNIEACTILQQCAIEARNVLVAPSCNTTDMESNLELEKKQLRAIICDASIRRFKCQQIYLRASATRRWVMSRDKLLGNQKARGCQVQKLQAIDREVKAELESITDDYVDYCLRAEDLLQGKWLDEDPDLATIQHYIYRGVQRAGSH
ncbi:hypothetical protein HDK77DRAFT_244703 [Phyllosticta capitalensis]|uniref:Fungal N-terminal domain-containing protein n=1 Tax=Phyllosticta capitalensis TaxID=121624 RepID=A0ABR1YNA3_9PEZI